MLRKKKHMTLQEVADFLDVNKSSVSRWEKGETSKIKKSVLSSLASLYDVPFEFLSSSKDLNVVPAKELTPYHPKEPIPILGKIAAGLPLYADENLEGYTYSDKTDGNEYFSLRVNGDSMNAARIEEGDLLIIRKQNYVENGDIAAVMVNGSDATVKKFYRDNDTVMLIPMSTNPKHQIQVYNIREKNIMILGKVVENKIKFY